jgi:multiple sugar transport system permease protein
MSSQDYGVGSAAAIILTIIIVIFTLIQGWLLGFGKANLDWRLLAVSEKSYEG